MQQRWIDMIKVIEQINDANNNKVCKSHMKNKNIDRIRYNYHLAHPDHIIHLKKSFRNLITMGCVWFWWGWIWIDFYRKPSKGALTWNKPSTSSSPVQRIQTPERSVNIDSAAWSSLLVRLHAASCTSSLPARHVQTTERSRDMVFAPRSSLLGRLHAHLHQPCNTFKPPSTPQYQFRLPILPPRPPSHSLSTNHHIHHPCATYDLGQKYSTTFDWQ